MQALCAEQLTELRGMFERILCVARSSGGPTVGNIQLADRLINAVVSWSESLAQPEPEGPTLDDIVELCADHEFMLGVEGANEEESAKGLLEVVRAILTRYARPTIEPVPVSEEPWEREGWCDTEGQCWWWHPATDSCVACWCYSRGNGTERLCLPHNALPLPTKDFN